MKIAKAVLVFVEADIAMSFSVCPKCGASSTRQWLVGTAIPQVVAGEHSVEVHVNQCLECETFYVDAVDDFGDS